ncbi:HAD-IIIC family phosphatase [Chryseobacterium sp. MEBOG07]|uniref:HAD-IIIC family phosphatase n=1 Tax=Chryseobacterium sp. MEBOG07 TaxID=2879939 RepID=UPI001F177CF2|nr:HAD-IIIC family phosphatase [Chryseobacterium sp. MEBOG07]UKB80685.1 HAD-IIIC family phosphatase [Chryseobacterium sp. MEBOG07]
MKPQYIYRNYTVEYLFDSLHHFSGYGDVSPALDHKEQTVFYQLNPSFTPEEQIMEIEDIKSKISFIINLNQEARIAVVTLYRNVLSGWETKNNELLNAIDDFNINFLGALISENRNVKIIDINTFFQSQNISLIDWRFFFTSQMIINPKLAKNFKTWFAKQISGLDLKRKKCIVLDCDNTLWGGVVGEDGTFGIKLGMDYPGLCFKSFQNLLLMLSKKGVILTVCSKNNVKDVQDVWENNTNNIINDTCLSAYRINWNDKASNIKSMAEELNIGLDSFVFIDDNPVERGLVKEFLPEVEVPDFPEKSYDLVDFFWKIYNDYFSVYELSNEDLKKTQQYKENFVRSETKKAFENMDEYLSSLEIEIDIFNGGEQNIQRIAQMTQKTNQFNLTTKRYTEQELFQVIKDGGSIYCANVKDKFGDNGITIAGIFKEDKNNIFVDSYLLSCRILGRDIEKVALIKILDQLITTNDKKIFAEFIPTSKNAVAEKFLEDVGFELIETEDNGTRKYAANKENLFKAKEYYKVNYC